jgi:hypothetical protein
VQDWGTPRAKTVTWYDPLVTASAGAGLSGLEFVRALADGTLPPAPLALILGFRAVEAAEGRVVFEATPDESVGNVMARSDHPAEIQRLASRPGNGEPGGAGLACFATRERPCRIGVLRRGLIFGGRYAGGDQGRVLSG